MGLVNKIFGVALPHLKFVAGIWRGASIVALMSFHANSFAISGSGGAIESKMQSQPFAFFEENKGQVSAPYRYFARGKKGNIFIRDRGLDLLAHSQNKPITIEFSDANPQGGWVARDSSGTYVNYVKGSKPKSWLKNVKTYQRVYYKDVYEGIDADLHYARDGFEFDFLLKPGADPNRIRVSYRNADSLRILKDGQLEVKSGNVTLLQHLPYVYQTRNDKTISIPTTYSLVGSNTIAFRVEAYDLDLPLVIDPIVEFATYWGGTGSDMPYAATVFHDTGASDDYIYITGVTVASGNPSVEVVDNLMFKKADAAAKSTSAQLLHGINRCSTAVLGSGASTGFLIDYDGYIGKFSRAQQKLLYVTFLGGCGRDEAKAIKVDAAKNIYVGGLTSSLDFPTKSALQPSIVQIEGATKQKTDGFITKLNDTGYIVYSTYFGGNGDDSVNAIALDSNSRVYVVGDTTSSHWQHVTSCNLITSESKPGNQYTPCEYKANLVDPTKVTNDVFVASIGATGGAVNFMHYLGGRGDDFSSALAVKESLAGVIELYVAGTTASPDFPLPTTGTSYREYRSDPTGCTRLNIALDSHKHPCRDGFIAILANDALTLKAATFLGGDQDETIGQIALDALGKVYVAGTTLSGPGYVPDGNPVESNVAVNDITRKALLKKFPVLFPLADTSKDPIVELGSSGSTDSFVTKFNEALNEILFSTLISGSDEEISSSLYFDETTQTVYAGGYTRSTDFPIKNALQGFPVGGDGYVAKISPIFVDPPKERYDKPYYQPTLEYSTLIGGELVDKIIGVFPMSGSNKVFVVGSTFSEGVVTTDSSTKISGSTFSDVSDMFLMTLSEVDGDVELVTSARTANGAQSVGTDSDIAYEVTVKNTGSVMANQVRVAITLPFGGVSVVKEPSNCLKTRDITASANSADAKNNSGSAVIYFCTIDLINAGTTAQPIGITLRYSRPGMRELTVTAFSPRSEVDTANNTQFVKVTVNESPRRGFLALDCNFVLLLVLVSLALKTGRRRLVLKKPFFH